MASINCKSGCEGKPSSRSFVRSQERRVKVRRVMAARLETSRSIPELDARGLKPSPLIQTPNGYASQKQAHGLMWRKAHGRKGFNPD